MKVICARPCTRSRFSYSIEISHSRSESSAVLGGRSYCVRLRGHHHDRIRHWPLFLHATQVSRNYLLRNTMLVILTLTISFSQFENRGGRLRFRTRRGTWNDIFRSPKIICYWILDGLEICAAFAWKLPKHNVWLMMLKFHVCLNRSCHNLTFFVSFALPRFHSFVCLYSYIPSISLCSQKMPVISASLHG